MPGHTKPTASQTTTSRFETNRREFLKSTAAAAGAALSATPAGAATANQRIGVGVVGVGGRGAYHIRTIQRIAEEENLAVVAVCDAYGPRRRKHAEQTGAKCYANHHELLSDKSVDVVCIASPDRLHVPQALDAIRAGKDVYCEKPLGHWSQFDLSKTLLNETRRLGRVVQVGNQGNSSAAWQKIGQLIRRGTIGKIQHVQTGYYRYGDWGERMPIPDPHAEPGPDLDWEAFLGDAPAVPFSVERFFSWRAFLDYAGGPCTDLFPHVFTPFVSMLGLKYPTLVVSSGGIFKYDNYFREVPDTYNMCVDYPEKLSINLMCTLTNNYLTEPAIRGDEGTITLEGTRWEAGCESITIHPRKGEPSTVRFQIPDSTVAHWQNFLHCVRTRQRPVSDVEFGVHVQSVLCMSMLGFLNKKLATFDPDKEKIVLS